MSTPSTIPNSDLPAGQGTPSPGTTAPDPNAELPAGQGAPTPGTTAPDPNADCPAGVPAPCDAAAVPMAYDATVAVAGSDVTGPAALPETGGGDVGLAGIALVLVAVGAGLRRLVR